MNTTIKVDCNYLFSTATRMESLGTTINSYFNDISTSISGLHESWNGTRYNELVEYFNLNVTKINALLKLFVQDFPYSLRAIANEYRKADESAEKSYDQPTLNKMVELASYPDEKLKFLSSSVESENLIITNAFQSIIDKIEPVLNTLALYLKTWEGNSADSFMSCLSNLSTKSTDFVKELKKLLVGHIETSLDVIESTETKNTVTEKDKFKDKQVEDRTLKPKLISITKLRALENRISSLQDELNNSRSYC